MEIDVCVRRIGIVFQSLKQMGAVPPLTVSVAKGGTQDGGRAGEEGKCEWEREGRLALLSRRRHIHPSWEVERGKISDQKVATTATDDEMRHLGGDYSVFCVPGYNACLLIKG